MSREPYVWANLVMIDRADLATVEVRGQQIKATFHPTDRVARSNHHVEFGATPEDDDTVTTGPRLRAAVRRLRHARQLSDIFELQESHDDGESGICNHSSYDTVYSYVFESRGASILLHVTRGKPCRNPERKALRLPLGADWSPDAVEELQKAYPSERVPAPA